MRSEFWIQSLDLILRAAEGGGSEDGPEDEIDGRRAYALRNFGWRFSMNAFMPSF